MRNFEMAATVVALRGQPLGGRYGRGSCSEKKPAPADAGRYQRAEIAMITQAER
jgi:hypothetical protein